MTKRIRRITILVPNHALRDECGAPSAPPLGPALIAAVLRRSGADVAIIDADAENLTSAEVVRRCMDTVPDAVGISCNYITTQNTVLTYARELKRQWRGCIFVGGNHASAWSHAFLGGVDCPIDFVLKGEAEMSSATLVDALERNLLETLPGLCVHRDGRIVNGEPPRHVEDIGSLPEPAYDLLPMDRYSRYGIFTSRGCPYRCAYCASTAVFGTRVRLRRADAVVSEMALLRSRYGERPFWICDDTFTAVERHAREVAAAVGTMRPTPQWSCLASAATVSEDLLATMRAAGCEYISIGVESNHPDQRRFIGKPISDDLVIRAVAAAHQVGMRVYGFFILGFPGETESTIEARCRLITNARFDDVAVNLLIPLPGTVLWYELVAARMFDPEELDTDHLFARVADNGDSLKTAELVHRWTSLSASGLLEAVAKCRRLGREASPHYVPRECRR